MRSVPSLCRTTLTHMKRICIVAVLFFQIVLSQAQTSLKELNITQGTYGVGFKHYTKVDSTRTYQIRNNFDNQSIYRPIPISIWYPAKANATKTPQLTVLNYLEILKEEEEWEGLPNKFLLDWFPYLWNTPQNRAHLPEKTNAYSNASAVKEKFPVIVYAPSYQASSIENFALCEFLASHGYVVISSPSRGTKTRWLEGGTTKDMETQSRDVAFLLKEIYAYKNIDQDNVALMGFSFGGISNASAVLKNGRIRALISLDGSERYNYPVLEKSPYFDLDKFALPYVHFAQKDIPEKVMISDKIPSELNYKFQLYDSLQYSNAYSYKFHDLTHAYFSTYGVLFGNRDKRQDKSDAKIMRSYQLLCQHVLAFVNANLKKDVNAKVFIENSPVENGFSEKLVSKKMKKVKSSGFDYTNFNDLASKQRYKNLIALYKQTKKKYPQLQLPEGKLNLLGLHLSFNPSGKEKGVNVFLLALHIYPQSANLYDSLAEAYLYHGDHKNAIVNFKKSLVLNPQNQNAITNLKALEKKK